MASKRGAESGSGSSSAPPNKKRLLTQFEPVKIGPVCTQEEMDMKVLIFQNKKLAERIEVRKKAEEDLKKRIEQLEQRQTTDDAVLCIVNRYWNQLDEDVRVLLQRFDAESADESGKQNESPGVTSFLLLLSQWTPSEIEEQLRQRVEFSKRAIGKLLQAFDRLQQRNEKLWDAIKKKSEEDSILDDPKDTSIKSEKGEKDKETDKKEKDKTDDETSIKVEKTEDGKEIKQEKDRKVKNTDEGKTELAGEGPVPCFKLSDEVKQDMDRLMAECKRLQNLNSELHQNHHQVKLKNSELADKLAAAETQVAELKNQLEEAQYELDSANHRVDKLDRHLAETYTKLRSYQDSGAKTVGGEGGTVSNSTLNEMNSELEEQRDLAANRLTELEKLQKAHEEAIREKEKLKMDLSTLPESVIVETTEYKCLQSQFSVLYNESMQIKTQLEESRSMLATSKNTHLRQIEQMESDELACQKKLRTEVIQLEDQLAQVRREYEMLRLEFEQTLAANEQTGPINREMRNLITSLKKHNEQLKGEMSRHKKKLKETLAEIQKLKQDVEDQEKEREQEKKGDLEMDEIKAEDLGLGGDATATTPGGSGSGGTEKLDRSFTSESGEESSLKIELKKSQDRERELKLLLDMYKSAPKESRDKVQLMTIEKKLLKEVEELRASVRKLQEAQREDKRKLADEDAQRKIKKLEDSQQEHAKTIANQKQEEEALLSEMEVTGAAFEDMQEQNTRLLQQLREKDDANFKLMSERIKANQIHKLMREEKAILEEQIQTLHTQVEAQLVVLRKLEEKEQLLQNNLSTVEKELSLRQQALEMHKRKAVESAQTAADLKLHLDKYHSQMNEAQVSLAEKTSAVQSQSFKYKRIQEEVASLRRKLERVKKIEMASSADEVLQEEIREYKEQLTCPSCKVKKKDAILQKCFHVFCFDCLKTRYETRQRKCPKCNAAFGANDYHRIYLE